ncbi:hypothetical protein WJX73_001668 [Symbiochloris irregularis]|uniref:Protein kinase domain-containing protein n=1 Tax=Symbiochloris irregularis TaxID=706552 RepID=A0AAW1Q234_9CHLO
MFSSSRRKGQRQAAPELLSIERFPGNVIMLETEYLAPEASWERLDQAAPRIQDWEDATAVLEATVSALHKCCDNTAVHGDLRGPNILVRGSAPRWRPAPLRCPVAAALPRLGRALRL